MKTFWKLLSRILGRQWCDCDCHDQGYKGCGECRGTHPNKQRGNISLTSLIGWGLTIAVASVGFTMSQISKLDETDTQVVQRISVVETKSDQYTKDIESINKKLDILISKNK